MDLLYWPISDVSDRHTGHVRHACSAALTRVPRYKPSWINFKLWAMLLYHQCSILTEEISNPCPKHVDRTRSGVRVPWEKRWESDVKSKSLGLQPWSKPSPTQSLSLPFLGESFGRPRWGWGRRLGWMEGYKLTGPKGYALFYSPAHTGHVRYTRAGPSSFIICFLSSNPFLYNFLIQKHVCPWSK